jgi:hypothetical protein
MRDQGHEKDKHDPLALLAVGGAVALSSIITAAATKPAAPPETAVKPQALAAPVPASQERKASAPRPRAGAADASSR